MNLISEDYLMHYGVKGMKWGVRHDPELKRYGAREDAKSYKYNKSGESGWKGAKRAAKAKKQSLRSRYYNRKTNSIQKDINSFKGHENGISTKKGKQVLSSKDVKSITKSLEKERDKASKKANQSLRESLDKTYGKVGKRQKYTQKNQFYKMAGKNAVQSIYDGADFYKKSYKSIKSGHITEIGKHYTDWLNKDVNVIGITGYKKMKRSRYISGLYNPLY